MSSPLERDHFAQSNPAGRVARLLLDSGLKTLNRDTSSVIPLLLRPQTVSALASALRASHFNNLSTAFELVARGKPQITLFSYEKPVRQYARAEKVVEDMEATIRLNQGRLNQAATIQGIERAHFYRSNTTNAELLLTYYDILLGPGSKLDASMRAKVLSEQEGFVLSPLMKTLQHT